MSARTTTLLSVLAASSLALLLARPPASAGAQSASGVNLPEDGFRVATFSMW